MTGIKFWFWILSNFLKFWYWQVLIMTSSDNDKFCLKSFESSNILEVYEIVLYCLFWRDSGSGRVWLEIVCLPILKTFWAELFYSGWPKYIQRYLSITMISFAQYQSQAGCATFFFYFNKIKTAKMQSRFQILLRLRENLGGPRGLLFFCYIAYLGPIFLRLFKGYMRCPTPPPLPCVHGMGGFKCLKSLLVVF